MMEVGTYSIETTYGEITVQEVVGSVQHIAPHVIFQGAPISYLSEGLGEDFYANYGEKLDEGEESATLMYYIVRTS